MTQRDLLNARFGNPVLNLARFEAMNMKVWNCDDEFPELPFPRIYLNVYILPYLRETFRLLKDSGLLGEIKTFDGCLNVRYIRGSTTQMSIHSWGLALDLNASDNPLNMSREQCIEKGLKPFTEAFIRIWRDTGWVCGADFGRKDLMHFQRTKEFV